MNQKEVPLMGEMEIESKGIWPDHFVDDLRLARIMLQNEGVLGEDPYLLCSCEISDCLSETMPDESTTYRDFIIDNKLVKKIIPWASEKDYVVLLWHGLSYEELDINFIKILVKITGIKIRPLRDGKTIKEIQASLDSGDVEKVANAIWKLKWIWKEYSKKTREQLIESLKFTPTQQGFLEEWVFESS